MSNIAVFLDALMCVFWIMTYVLVLIGTVRYRYPLISPVAQFFFITNEIAVLLFFFFNASNFSKYVIWAYICWTLIEIAVFIAILKTGYFKKNKIFCYVCFEN